MPLYLVTKNLIAKTASIDGHRNDILIVESIQEKVRACNPGVALSKSFKENGDGTIWRPIRAEKIND